MWYRALGGVGYLLGGGLGPLGSTIDFSWATSGRSRS
jgi:hypothetical protein